MSFPNKKNVLFIVAGVALIVAASFAVVLFYSIQYGRYDEDVTKGALIATATPESLPGPKAQSSNELIVAFGDSITAGYGIDLADAYPSVLEGLLREAGYSVTVVNAGVSGETTAGGLRRVDFVISQKPDIVIVALGGNDVLRGIPPDNTRSNLSEIVEKFQGAGIRVILAGMRAPDNMGKTFQDEFDAMYPALAETYNTAFVPFLLEGVALDGALNQSDGIHPNPKGARIIAEQNIFPVLLPLLQRTN
jgi:acyl-CoA thioesterase-1